MLLILHLSDIHLSADRERNPCLLKVEGVASSLEELSFVRTNPPTDILVILSGDIAAKGKSEEYLVADELMSRLLGSIESRYGIRPVVTMVPGNHDCDFGLQRETRANAISSFDPTTVSIGYVTECAEVQAPFREFERRHAATAERDALVSTTRVRLTTGETVVVRGVNTAWMSRIEEQQGALCIPLHLATSVLGSNCDDVDLALTTFHHPYNWINAANARPFRELVDTTSDVVLTGHEHEATYYRKLTHSDSEHDYLEGAVFQESGDPDSSGFNAIAVDFANKTQSVATFAWTNGAFHLCEESETIPILREKDAFRRRFKFEEAFSDWLQDPGAPYKHPRTASLTLQDIFVYPDLTRRELAPRLRGKRRKTIRRRHFDLFLGEKRVTVSGPDQSGKTALAKTLAHDFHNQGIVPVVMRGPMLKGSDPKAVDRWAVAEVENSYGRDASLLQEFHQLPHDRRCAIVDGFDRTQCKPRERAKVLDYLCGLYDYVVVIGNEHFGLDEIYDAKHGSEISARFAHLQIEEMGYQTRSELIKRWCRIGPEYFSSEREYWDRVDALEKKVDFAISSALLPSYAGNILLILSLAEVQQEIATPGGTSAFLYEQMINLDLLNVARAPQEVDTLLSYLSALATYMDEGGLRQVPIARFRQWHAQYCERYDSDLDSGDMIGRLHSARILFVRDGQVGFLHGYVYYYFVARYFYRHLEEPSIRERVQAYSKRLYDEKCANVVLFLCYLSPVDFVINEVLSVADDQFASVPELDVVAAQSLVDALVGVLPDALLPDENTEANRRKIREHFDDFDDLRSGVEGDSAPTVVEGDSEIDEEQKMLLDLNSAFKTVEIVGQILRSFPGSLESGQKLRLLEANLGVTLRMTGWWFAVLDRYHDPIVDAIVAALTRDRGFEGVNEQQLRRRVAEALFRVISGLVTGSIRHLSASVASEALTPTFERAFASKTAVNAETRALIDVAIKLDTHRGWPREDVAALAARTEDQLLARSVLRSLVSHNLAVFPHPRSVRQFAASKLGLKVKNPEAMGSDRKRLPPPGRT